MIKAYFIIPMTTAHQAAELNVPSTRIIYDSSNGYNTTSREKIIENLPLKGQSRQLICNAIVSQSNFRVRSKNTISSVYSLNCGAPQGQCGSGELFAITNKLITLPPSFPQKTSNVFAIRTTYVDDAIDIITCTHKDFDYVHSTIDQKMIADNYNVGRKLNDEKTKTLIMGLKPLQIAKN